MVLGNPYEKFAWSYPQRGHNSGWELSRNQSHLIQEVETQKGPMTSLPCGKQVLKIIKEKLVGYSTEILTTTLLCLCL